MLKIKNKYLVVLFLLLFFSGMFAYRIAGFWECIIITLLAFFISIPIWSRLITYVRFFILDLFFDSILVNALFETKFGFVQHFNLGDDLNWFLTKRLQKKKVSLFGSSVVGRYFKKKENFLIIGSTITWLTNEKTVIWGAGVIDGNLPLNAKPKKVCAVRGPLSRKYLLEKGVDCPEIYGDPALLMKYFYKSHAEKKYKLGIIPHYVDFESGKFDSLKNNADVLFIKMQNYKSVQDVIDQISSCERILSSSLHGLILSETYNVPNMWMKVSDKITGGSFKYLDYYESIGLYNMKPYLFNGTESEEDILNLFKDYKKGCIDLRPLVESAPFEMNIKKEIV